MPNLIERHEDGYILNRPDGTWQLFWRRWEAEAQARKEGLLPADDLAWIDEIDFTRPAPGGHLGRMLGEVVGSVSDDDQPAPAA